jgi:hypothetical protein
MIRTPGPIPQERHPGDFTRPECNELAVSTSGVRLVHRPINSTECPTGVSFDEYGSHDEILFDDLAATENEVE